MDLHVVMRTLAGKRPVFHSEADSGELFFATDR